MPLKKYLTRTLLALCLVIGVWLLLSGITEQIAFSERTDGYVSAVGYYTDKEVYRDGRAGSRYQRHTSYVLVYTYNAGGVEYTARTDYGTGTLPEKGSEKLVLYDPEDPSRAVVTGTNASTVKIFIGLFFTLIPLVMLLILSAAGGRFGSLTFNLMDLAIGAVMVIIGGGTIYLIAGGFSLSELWMLAGPFGAIPVLLIAAGVWLIGRGITVRHKE